MSKTTLNDNKSIDFEIKEKKTYLRQTKNEKWKSIVGFEPALFSGPVQIQKFCNAIPTQPFGTWEGIDVKYTWMC